MQYAIRCGELLIHQKAKLRHGEFKPWIEANCEFSYLSAAVYMKAAEQKCRGLHFSSLAQALSYANEKPAPPVPPPTLEPEPDITAIAVAAVGLTPESYAQAKAVVEANEEDPDRFSDIVHQMDTTGDIGAAYNEMCRRKGHSTTPAPDHEAEQNDCAAHIADLDGPRDTPYIGPLCKMVERWVRSGVEQGGFAPTTAVRQLAAAVARATDSISDPEKRQQELTLLAFDFTGELCIVRDLFRAYFGVTHMIEVDSGELRAMRDRVNAELARRGDA